MSGPVRTGQRLPVELSFRAVLTAVPVDDVLLPVAPMELVAGLRTALAATELTDAACADDVTVPATALVVCEPVAGPPRC